MHGYGRRQAIVAVLSLCCLCLSALASAQDLAKAKSDFLSANPNNGWTFGFLDRSGSFVAYNTTFKVNETTVGWCLDGMPGVFGDITMCFDEKPLDKFCIRWEPGQLCVNPGLDCQGVVIRWTAPGPATIRIDGRLEGIAKGGGRTNFRISKDGNTLASDEVAGEGFVEFDPSPPEMSARAVAPAAAVARSAELSKSVTVAKGTTIDFIFARDGEMSGGHVGFDLNMQTSGAGGKVSYNPSPLGPRAQLRIASAKAVTR